MFGLTNGFMCLGDSLMTTNKQLQEWLKRFPDDALIEVVTSEESKGHWESYIEASHEDLILPDIQVENLTWSQDFDNVVFDFNYDHEQPGKTIVKTITLGKAHYD
jgi:hypothetical protein